MLWPPDGNFCAPEASSDRRQAIAGFSCFHIGAFAEGGLRIESYVILIWLDHP